MERAYDGCQWGDELDIHRFTQLYYEVKRLK